MSGPAGLFPPRNVSLTGTGKANRHHSAVPLLQSKQEEDASCFIEISDSFPLPKPAQCMTELLRQCISAFAWEKPQDRDSNLPNQRQLSSRHSIGATRQRTPTAPQSGDLKRIPAAGFCTLCSSTDSPHHEVSFRWLKVGELVTKEDIRTISSNRESAIALPMVYLEGASTRPSHKTSKGWEIIKSGMDYVLGRSIVPTTKSKVLDMPCAARKNASLSKGDSSECHRLSKDGAVSSSSSSSLSATSSTCFAPRIQSRQVFASTQESKAVAESPVLFKRDAVAGALAGMCVSLCLHPVDTVKTVIQAQSGGQRSILHTILTIISGRGILGLYRGLGSNLTSSAPISAIYTFTYESVKAALLPHLPKEYHAIAHCTAGGCASVATSIVYTPSECVKQRMQVGSLYRNSWLTLLGILKNGGLSVLYSGWVAVLCRNVPQSVIKFYTYEGLKHYALGGLPDGTPLSTYQTLAIGGMAGSTAALFTTPFDVIKTRLQTQIPGSVLQQKGVFQAFQHIAASEGIAGLYRGLIPRLVIYVSQGALFFATYEFFKQLLAMEVKKLCVLACHSTDVVGRDNVVEST